MAARQRMGELQAYKDRVRRQREINNLDQRIYLDQEADWQSSRRPGPQMAAGNRDRLPLAQDRDVRQLQIEYERAREGGGGVGRGAGRGRGRGRPRPPGPFHPPRPVRRPVARVEQTAPDTPRYNPHNDPKVQMLAENHGRQMEFLHGKNKELERQREEIRRRLEELGRRPPEKKDNSHEELLRELREQEERNQRLLEELRRQLMEARRPMNIVRTQEHMTAGRQQSPPKKNFIYPLYYGNSLVAEIVAVRQAYMQNGGNDPDILAQLAQMQAEAQAIEDAMRNAQQKQPRGKKSTTNITANFSSLELENERLVRQLQLLQEQKIIASNRRHDTHREGMDAPSVHRPASPPSEPQSVPQPSPSPPPTTVRLLPPPALSPQPPKGLATGRSVSKGMQTNPVPSDLIQVSAIPRRYEEDYYTKRQNAKNTLEGKWGPPRAGTRQRPFATSNNTTQTQPPGGGRRDDPDAIETLQPGRGETVKEADLGVDFIDPNEPLDVKLSAIPSRPNRRAPYPFFPPFKPRHIGPYPNRARAVIIKTEPLYGKADYFGRPVDENGNLIQDDDEEALKKWMLWKRSQGWDEKYLEKLARWRRRGQPRRKYDSLDESANNGSDRAGGRGHNSLNIPARGLNRNKVHEYELMLQNMFKRSDDLLRRDPYYYKVHGRRRRNSAGLEGEKDHVYHIYGHRHLTPTLHDLKAHNAVHQRSHPGPSGSGFDLDNDDKLQLQLEQLGYTFAANSRRTHAGAQTDLIDPHEDQMVDTFRSQPLDSYQDQTIDRRDQTIGRTQGQTIDRPQGQSIDRPQGQTIDRPQGQMTGRPPGQMTQRPQGQMTQRPQGQVIDGPQGQMTDRTEGQTTERRRPPPPTQRPSPFPGQTPSQAAPAQEQADDKSKEDGNEKEKGKGKGFFARFRK